MLPVLFAFALWADDVALEAVAKLGELGLKPVSGVAVAAEETDFAKALAAFAKVNRDLAAAAKEHAVHERKFLVTKTEAEAIRKQLQGLRVQYSLLPTNQLGNQINFLQEDLRSKDKLLEDENTGKESRAKLSKARAAYLEKTMELRKGADAAQAKYEELAKNPAVRSAVAAAAEATGKPLALGPSKQFERNVAALEKFELKTNTEDIALRKEGNTFRIDVTLNGEHAAEMIFDTGASSVSLPAGLARRIGLVPTPQTPQVEVSIADGRKFPAHRMELASVKVGKFTARNVECIVMPAEFADAPALLGGAFLNRFNYTMDQGTGKLKLTLLADDAEPAPKAKAGKKTPAKKKN
jgi:clan AA aspartic protease (TIGR02281 family)